MSTPQPNTKAWISSQIPTIKQQLQAMQAQYQQDTQTASDLRQEIANKQAELSVRESNLVRDQRGITTIEGNLNAFEWIAQNAPNDEVGRVDTPPVSSDNASAVDGNDRESS